MSKERIICGRRVIKEILKSEISIEEVYVSKKINLDNVKDIIDYANDNNIIVKFFSSYDMDNICNSKVHQGVAVKISDYRYFKFNDFLNLLELEKFPIVLILDSIQDPQNLGAILRSAECMGIKNVIIPQRKSANITDIVWKTSMGALAYLNICRVNNLKNAILKLKEREFKIVATAIDSKENLYESNYNYPLVLIVGNEHSGIQKDFLSLCDIKVRIPMYGNIDSLNVSVATGIVMYEIKNKQRGLIV